MPWANFVVWKEGRVGENAQTDECGVCNHHSAVGGLAEWYMIESVTEGLLFLCEAYRRRQRIETMPRAAQIRCTIPRVITLPRCQSYTCRGTPRTPKLVRGRVLLHAKTPPKFVSGSY